MTDAFMLRAIELAVENVRSGRGGPFAAVVVRDGLIVADGVNSVTTSNDPTAHAEINAIRSACQNLLNYQLTDCDLYTTCEPCPMCLGAIYWARLAKVYFASTREDAGKAGFDDSFIYQEIARPVDRRAVPMIPIMREDSLVAFREWDQLISKVRY